MSKWHIFIVIVVLLVVSCVARDDIRYLDRGPREMHHATCEGCGKDILVPFKPDGSRPIYCGDCYQKYKLESAGRFSQTSENVVIPVEETPSDQYIPEVKQEAKMKMVTGDENVFWIVSIGHRLRSGLKSLTDLLTLLPLSTKIL